jgi:predicted dinucleotide-binding enzyme
MGKPSIGIIGKGNVGSALEQGLSNAGYEVRTSGHEPDEVRDVGAWGDLLILAVPYGERSNALQSLGDAVQGKTLVDVTNAVEDGIGFAGSLEQSGAEELQDQADGANVVKAFNTVFANQMAKGHTQGNPLTVFVAGDDPQAKKEAAELGEAVGFEVVDAGELRNARWLEPLGYLNMQIANVTGKNNGGFHFVQPGTSSARTTKRQGQRPKSGAGGATSSRRRQPMPARRQR